MPGPDGQAEVPLVLMANKRDLPNPTPIDKIREVLNAAHLPNVLIYETIAITGVNVKRAFVFAAREAVLRHYMRLQQGNVELPQTEE